MATDHAKWHTLFHYDEDDDDEMALAEIMHKAFCIFPHLLSDKILAERDDRHPLESSNFMMPSFKTCR